MQNVVVWIGEFRGICFGGLTGMCPSQVKWMSFPELVSIVWKTKRPVYESLQLAAKPTVEKFLAGLKT